MEKWISIFKLIIKQIDFLTYRCNNKLPQYIKYCGNQVVWTVIYI